MNRNIKIALFLTGAGALLYLLSRTNTATQAIQSIGDTVTASLSGWQNVQQGPQWVPYINGVEATYNIPTNLLARIAYQESSFLPDVITGARVSSAGALGIMQLMPQYFSTVQVPLPFSVADTQAQIAQAAQLLSSLYSHFGDWSLAIAGYNDGQGNIDSYLAGSHSLPQQTTDYVSEVLADVPVAANALLA